MSLIVEVPIAATIIDHSQGLVGPELPSATGSSGHWLGAVALVAQHPEQSGSRHDEPPTDLQRGQFTPPGSGVGTAPTEAEHLGGFLHGDGRAGPQVVQREADPGPSCAVRVVVMWSSIESGCRYLTQKGWHVMARSGRRRVVVPLFAESVADRRARADALGLDPDSRVARLVADMAMPAPDWEAAVDFDAAGQPVGFEVRSLTGQPLTPAIYRQVRYAEVLAEAVAQTEYLAPVTGREPLPAVKTRKGRPRTYDDAHYRRVAKVYADAVAAGSAKPVRVVARVLSDPAFGFGDLTTPTDHRARSWVRTATALGLISEAELSKKGGTG